MSIWAHSVPSSTADSRKAAAVIAPPVRAPVLFRIFGDLAFDSVAVLVGERHGPHPIPGRRSGRPDGLDEGFRFSEKATEVLAEADRDRPGEGGDVDHALGTLALGVGDAVDEDAASLRRRC